MTKTTLVSRRISPDQWQSVGVKELEDNAMVRLFARPTTVPSLPVPVPGKPSYLPSGPLTCCSAAYRDHLAEFSRSATSVMLQATLPRVCAVVAIPNKLTASTSLTFRCLCESSARTVPARALPKHGGPGRITRSAYDQSPCTIAILSEPDTAS